MTTRGAFITFEGGDGAGKTTQIARLAAHLRASGHDVVTTREPGGAPGAEEIRALLVSGATDRWTPLTEALLVYAARAEHMARTITPALARGAVVLCDRFSDSTRAYQGHAGALGTKLVEELDGIVVGDNGPDLTLVLDGGGQSLARAAPHDGEDRFERKGPDFQARVRAAFLAIAKAHAERCVVIKTDRDIDDVAADIAAVVEARLGLG